MGADFRHLGLYIVPNVLPYVLPFGVALSLHRELREQILQLAKETNITNRGRMAKVRPGRP